MTARLPVPQRDPERSTASGDGVPNLRAFAARLARLHALSGDDQAALEQLPMHETVVARGQDIVRAGDRTNRCAVILDGMALGYKLTPGGRCQVLGLYLAGDAPALESLLFGRTNAGVAAASECRAGYVPNAVLSELCSCRPNLMAALWRDTLCQAAIVSEWLLNVGRRDALARLAHLMCEALWRHRAAGLTSDRSCSFPLSQAVLADALGLSTVHVNRSLKELRRRGLVEWRGARLMVLDWEGLRMVAEFHPGYLQFGREPLASLDGGSGANLRDRLP